MVCVCSVRECARGQPPLPRDWGLTYEPDTNTTAPELPPTPPENVTDTAGNATAPQWADAPLSLLLAADGAALGLAPAPLQNATDAMNNATASNVTGPPARIIASNTTFTRGNLTLPRATVCRLTKAVTWRGAWLWCWLLFFALWVPCGWLGHVLAWLLSTTIIKFWTAKGSVRPHPIWQRNSAHHHAELQLRSCDAVR